jgi:hypothetical protein
MTDMINKDETCINCNTVNIDNYCSNCGQKRYRERFTLKKFFFVLLDQFNIKKGIIYTFKELLLHPGRVINDYLSGKTKPYFSPLNYLLIAAGLYAFLVIWLNIFDSSIDATNKILINESMQNNEEVLEMQKRFIDSIKGYMNLIPLLLVPFASLVSKWFYRSKKLYYGEHLIVICFLFAQGFLMTLLLTPLFVLIPKLKVFFGVVLALMSIAYLSVALYRFFKGSKFRAVIGALSIYVGGMLIFYLFLIIITIIIGTILTLLGYSITDLL